MLQRKDQSLKEVAKVLREFYNNVDDEPEPAAANGDGKETNGPDVEEGPSQKMILQGLIDFLEGC